MNKRVTVKYNPMNTNTIKSRYCITCDCIRTNVPFSKLNLQPQVRITKICKSDEAADFSSKFTDDGYLIKQVVSVKRV